MNSKSQRQLKVNRHLVLGFYYFEKRVFRKSNQSKFSAIKIFLYIGPNNLLMHHFSSDLHWKWENTIFRQRLKISKFWQSGLVKNQPSNFFFFFFAILRPTEQLYPFISAYNVGTPRLEVPLFWVSLVIKVPSFLQSHLSIALCLDFCLKPSDLDKPGYSMISWVIFCCFLHALLCILH